jgi:ComF family protein
MLEKLLSFLFPTVCLSCDAPGTHLCADCKKELQPHPELCSFCHRISPHWATCFNCKPLYPATKGIGIWFQYTGVIKQLIRKLKYNHRRKLAPFLAERLALLIQTHPHLSKALHNDQLVITRVPSHRWRNRFIKGYNQSQLLAQEVASQLNMPCIELATKVKHTRSQTKLSKKQRVSNLIHAFKVLQNSSDIRDQTTLLIVDDITTTGSTINELAETIQSIYPHMVIWWWVVARHGK